MPIDNYNLGSAKITFKALDGSFSSLDVSDSSFNIAHVTVVDEVPTKNINTIRIIRFCKRLQKEGM